MCFLAHNQQGYNEYTKSIHNLNENFHFFTIQYSPPQSNMGIGCVGSRKKPFNSASYFFVARATKTA